MFRAATRSLGVFATLSALLIVGLPTALAASKAPSPCGWDSASGGGWRARMPRLEMQGGIEASPSPSATCDQNVG